MGRAYLVVEGHGDGQAALNVVMRLAEESKYPWIAWAGPIRGLNLHMERGVQKAAELVRRKGDAIALMILRDEDDGCPKSLAPRAASWLRSARLPFRSALVLAHREFEALFLPCAKRMAGQKLVGPAGISRPGLNRGAKFSGDPQSIRGVKEWLSNQMSEGRSYKPTLDQLPMARMVDFGTIRASEPPLPWFGTLERAVAFLYSQEKSSNGDLVYPPA